MTVIRPNSVSGITSITAQANEINFFRSNGALAGLQLNGVNFNTTTGVSTFNNLDVGGVLTYQDVTNVDSLGIGTFRTGINVSGGQLDVGSNIKIGNAGVITATSFSGSGANLTGIDTDLVSDTSPQLGGNLDVNTKNILFGDSGGASDDRLVFGAGTDMSLYHDGNNSVIENATGDLYIQNEAGNTSNQIFIRGKESTNSIVIHGNGPVVLYDQNTGSAVQRLTTTSTGVTISGNANFANNNKAIFGTGNDAEIYHNDTDFVINAQASGATRNIYLYAGTVNEGGIYLYSSAGDTMFKALTDSSCFLYFDNALKFRTMTDHCEIRGHLLPDVNNTDDLGSSSKRFRNLYVNDLQLSNEAKKDEGGNNVDGTWGDWTLQEGESDVYMINNRSGKKFKIKMEEVE